MNQTFTHPGQPQMQVEVILASRGSNGAPPIYTIRLRYPRPIHGEIMTHRKFARNARSSRAVPVKTMLNEVRTIPYVPWHWGKNQAGMQASEECNEPISMFGGYISNGVPTATRKEVTREEAWLEAARHAADAAEAFMTAGYHKQNPNRLLEPFSWIDTLITATDWKNFLHLRDHKDAEPHLQDLARLVKEAMAAAEIQELPPGYWHVPYIRPEEYRDGPWTCFEEQVEYLCKISAARCARISYKPFDGDASYDRELERYNQLVTSERIHASPLEHQATPDTIVKFTHGGQVWAEPRLHGNLFGWIQFRKTIEGEAIHG